jgi:hypothetical protein
MAEQPQHFGDIFDGVHLMCIDASFEAFPAVMLEGEVFKYVTPRIVVV